MYRTFTSAVKLGSIVALMVFLVASATATTTPEPNSSPTMTPSTTSKPMVSKAMTAVHPRYQRLDRLIGRPVYGSAGEKLGNIEDLVLDARDNSISYAVLSYGGFLGYGNKLFAVPWSEFTPNTEKAAYTLDVRRQYLKNAPGFEKDRWPNMADRNWAQQITTFYRQGSQARTNMSASQSQSQGAMQGALPIKYRRVTCLVGLAAKDFQGERLGELEDIVVDRSNNQAIYGVVLLPTTPWALERKEALVPWSTIEVMPKLAALKVGTDKKTLESVAFARHDFPDLANPQYARSIDSRYQSTTPYWETLGFVPGKGPMGQEAQTSNEPAKEMNVSVWQAGSKYNQRFDPGLVTTVTGKIQSIGVFSIARGAVSGLQLSVKTADGQVKTIYAGPRPYLESQGMTLHFGDNVTVTGAPTRFGWRGQVLMAATVQTQDKTVRLRSTDGTPQWNTSTLLHSSR